MKAVTWHGKRDVRVEQVPDPVIKEPNDAIVRITSTNICGSDLHLYEVLAAFMEPGDILGHEPMGVVEEVGPEAAGHISPGDRVVIPFNISCGHCWMCERQLFAQCETTQNREQGKGASLFGYTKLYGQVPGRPGRVPAGAAGPVRADPGARGPAGRPLPVPVRHPAHRVAGGPVRGRPARRDGGRVRARPGRAVRRAQREGHGRGPRVRRGSRARAAGDGPPARHRGRRRDRGRRRARLPAGPDRGPRPGQRRSTRSGWRPTATRSRRSGRRLAARLPGALGEKAGRAVRRGPAQGPAGLDQDRAPGRDASRSAACTAAPSTRCR